MSRAQILADLLHAGWRPPPLTTDQADRLLDDIHDADKYITRGDPIELTERELTILTYRAEGLSTPTIARKMKRSHDTINDALTSARRKLDAKNTTHAVALAIGKGLIEAPQ